MTRPYHRKKLGSYKVIARDYVKEYGEGEVENLTTLMEAYAKLNGYKMNPDARRVDMVIRGLLGREHRYGMHYCPSRSLIGDPSFDALISCPCVFMQDDVDYNGSCFCKMFFRLDFEGDYVTSSRNVDLPGRSKETEPGEMDQIDE